MERQFSQENVTSVRRFPTRCPGTSRLVDQIFKIHLIRDKVRDRCLHCNSRTNRLSYLLLTHSSVNL